MNPRTILDETRYIWQRASQPLRFRRLETPPGGWPILLNLSFPKSGTNLLGQILAAFCQVAPFSDRTFDVFATFQNDTGRQAGAPEALTFLRGRRPLDVLTAHLLAWPEVVSEAQQPRYLPFFIYRDPRDVVVSHAFYVSGQATRHAHHEYYTQTLKTFDERLLTSIVGRPELTDIEFPDIGRRFAPYLGWTRAAGVLPLKFEDLIQDREAALGRVADHFLARIGTIATARAELIDVAAESISPRKSRTFRSGKTGEWRDYFNEAHKAAFKEVAGDLLIELGYERDLNW